MKLHLLLGFQKVFVTNVYMITLYSMANLKGNVFSIGMIFGAAKELGVFFGERILKLATDVRMMILACSIFLTAFTIIKLFDIGDQVLLALFLVQIFVFGIMYSLSFIMQAERMDPTVNPLSLELNLCMG